MRMSDDKFRFVYDNSFDYEKELKRLTIKLA